MMLEIRRKLVHASGIFLIFIIIWLGKWNAALIILSIAVAFLLLGEYRKNKEKYKIIKSKELDEIEESIEKVFKEHERPNTLPFKGVTEFFIGCFLATMIFEPTIAIAAIAVLSLADAVSTLIGSYYGKHKLPINRKKTFEGSAAFFLTAIFILFFFANPLKAFIVAILATFAEMIPRIDDNLTVPLVVGIVMVLIS
jgi:dolichol kinase